MKHSYHYPRRIKIARRIWLAHFVLGIVILIVGMISNGGMRYEFFNYNQDTRGIKITILSVWTGSLNLHVIYTPSSQKNIQDTS